MIFSRIPSEFLTDCDPEDLERMKEYSRGFKRFVGISHIGSTRYFRFESPKQILECSVKVTK